MTFPLNRIRALECVGASVIFAAVAQGDSPASPAPSDNAIIWSTNALAPRALWGFTGAETNIDLVRAQTGGMISRTLASVPERAAPAPPPAVTAPQHPGRSRERDNRRVFEQEKRERSLWWNLWLPAGLPRMYADYGWIWPAGGRPVRYSGSVDTNAPPVHAALATVEVAAVEVSLEPQGSRASAAAVPDRLLASDAETTIEPQSAGGPTLIVMAPIIPEPGVMALFAAGLVAWGVFRASLGDWGNRFGGGGRR